MNKDRQTDHNTGSQSDDRTDTSRGSDMGRDDSFGSRGGMQGQDQGGADPSSERERNTGNR